jgi:tetratricopeptide (TPR) repeat protein
MEISTLITPAVSAVDKIPLGRRIEEIKKQKGGYYSTSAMAGRIGIHTETLRGMLKGKRDIYNYELEKIAKDLKVPVKRILQDDIIKQRDALNLLVTGPERTKDMLQQACVIANELVETAMGISERGCALQNLGRVQYVQRQYDEAHSTWLRTLEYAKKIQQEYNDKQLLKIVSANLMLTYALRKEYSNIDDFLCVVEEMFADDHDKLGMVFFTRAQVQQDRGNLEAAKMFAYRSLEHFEQTHDDRQIGHALINVAHFEYRFENYSASARSLSSAIRKVNRYEDILVVAVKEYVKSLMKLGENSTAKKVVEQYDHVSREYPDYWGKLQIMKTVLMDDPKFADSISGDAEMSLQVRYHACKCLFEFYAKKGDAATALNYYEKGRRYTNANLEFFEEGGY